MPTSKKTLIIVLNLVLLLVFFNLSVLKKERVLKNGKLVLLELAPVDPRSLMQGDYMQLNYALNNQIQATEKIPKRGYAVIRLNESHVAELVRLQPEKEPLQAGEHLIRYFKNDWQISIGAESFFFEEGQANTYQNAQYGGLRLDDEGNSILIGLYSSDLKLIGQNPEKE